jgi:hypothetical protein
MHLKCPHNNTYYNYIQNGHNALKQNFAMKFWDLEHNFKSIQYVNAPQFFVG